MVDPDHPTIGQLLEGRPLSFIYRWCTVSPEKPCCCLGCANISCGLVKHGYTKQDWLKWVHENPEPSKDDKPIKLNHSDRVIYFAQLVYKHLHRNMEVGTYSAHEGMKEPYIYEIVQRATDAALDDIDRFGFPDEG